MTTAALYISLECTIYKSTQVSISSLERLLSPVVVVVVVVVKLSRLLLLLLLFSYCGNLDGARKGKEFTFTMVLWAQVDWYCCCCCCLGFNSLFHRTDCSALRLAVAVVKAAAVASTRRRRQRRRWQKRKRRVRWETDYNGISNVIIIRAKAPAAAGTAVAESIVAISSSLEAVARPECVCIPPRAHYSSAHLALLLMPVLNIS